MQRQSETRAGNHERHTRTRNASLPTQANHIARGARKQPPNQGAIHAASEVTTHTCSGFGWPLHLSSSPLFVPQLFSLLSQGLGNCNNIESGARNLSPKASQGFLPQFLFPSDHLTTTSLCVTKRRDGYECISKQETSLCTTATRRVHENKAAKTETLHAYPPRLLVT